MNEVGLPGLLLSAVLLATAGSMHCAGMCGGLSTAFTFSIPPARRRGYVLWGWHGLFSTGRLSAYVGLGALAGATGDSLLGTLPGPTMRVGLALAGILMLLLSLYFLGQRTPLGWLERAGKTLWQQIQPATRVLVPVDSVPKALLLGGLWGLMPCGLVYSALAVSAASTSPLHGALIMLVFGAITLLPVTSAGILGSQVQRLQHGRWPVMAALITLVLSGWFLWQAAVPESPHTHQTAPAVEHLRHSDFYTSRTES